MSDIKIKTQELAILCPGQGSQTQAMLSEFVDTFPIVKQTFEEASDYLKYDLWNLIQTNPDNKLNLTQYTQVALFVASASLWRLWQQEINLMPKSTAGHSLGEYSAIFIADAFSFQAGLQLVNLRGNLMAKLGEKTAGAMAAIIGLDSEILQKICTQASKDSQIVEAVNFNSKEQTVIAGTLLGVQNAIEAAKSAGAKIATQLPVSIAAHSSLMQEASADLTQALAELEFQQPSIEIFQNVTGAKVSQIAELKNNLSLQLYSPVKWHTSIENMLASGIKTFVELGAGKVLSGLNKRIDKSTINFSTTNLKDWDKLLASLA